MSPSSALILLLCLAAQSRSGLDVDAPGFAARFDAGTLVQLADADGAQYVNPPKETVGLGVHTLSGEFHADAAEGPGQLRPDGTAVQHCTGFHGLDGVSAECRVSLRQGSGGGGRPARSETCGKPRGDLRSRVPARSGTSAEAEDLATHRAWRASGASVGRSADSAGIRHPGARRLRSSADGRHSRPPAPIRLSDELGGPAGRSSKGQAAASTFGRKTRGAGSSGWWSSASRRLAVGAGHDQRRAV